MCASPLCVYVGPISTFEPDGRFLHMTLTDARTCGAAATLWHLLLDIEIMYK
jgi:hypothetical protein